MGSQQAVQLSKAIREKVNEMKKLCEGIDEKTASRAPSKRWSPKQIISHVSGPEGMGFTVAVRAFLDQDTPRLDLTPANPFFTERRSKMTITELVNEFQAEYNRIIELVAGLSDEQLARKAYIPVFKETPMGEYPTLQAFATALTERHLGFHIDHMKEILAELAASSH